MKNLLFLGSFFFFSCQQKMENETTETKADSSFTINDSLPPGPTPGHRLTNEDKVAAIRDIVQHINAQTLHVKNFNWSEPSCADVGTIAYYLDKEEIVKVIETGFIGDGGWTKEYYYDKGKFIFSYEKNIGGPAGLPADSNELRIYMDADTLVLQRKNKEYLEDVSKNLTASSREYRILKALETKKFGAALCN
ncbi:MAG: hypothetical protein EOP53_13990 [Sphingobacteriales bacterium]|nr:MAG: hypothetical protein EOP53_13990 [Sphingobacteriales bacterium]